MGSSTIFAITGENITAWATVALVLIAAVSSIFQARFEKNSKRMELLIDDSIRFDSREMRFKRRDTAYQFTSHVEHKAISKDIPDFFEGMGLKLRKGFLEKKEVWEMFGTQIIYWWLIYKSYVERERELEEDRALYRNFEWLGIKIIKMESKRNPQFAGLDFLKEKMKRFLDAQKALI